MKILLITGRLAEPYVREIVSKTKTRHEIDVLALPVQVISLLSTSDIARYLARRNIGRDKYDLIIIPGLCRGSCREIYNVIHIPCVKGPEHFHDLDIILELDNPAEILSDTASADNIINKLVIEKNKKMLRELEDRISEYIVVDHLKIPIKPPPFRIVSEISEAYRLSIEELRKKIEYYIREGADIISLGFEPYNPRPDQVYNVVRIIKKEYDIPLAIDSLIPSDIRAGVEAGADIVFSLDLCNIDKVHGFVKDAAVVLIPYDHCNNILGRNSDEKLLFIEKLYRKAGEYGLERIVLDPILDPPITGNIVDSLYTYKLLREKYNNPLMIGVGNVTELYDVDSIGLNALLVLTALDIGASIILAVEASNKTKGSTRELKIASQMTTLGYLRKNPPKNLGIDLLIVKDKKKIDIPLEIEGSNIVELNKYRVEYRIDPKGVFKIRVNHEHGVIEALYIGVKGKILIRGRDAESISNYIVENGLVSTLSHAIYLGRELAKAEEALRLGKNYVQEKPLFMVKKPITMD